MRCSLIANLGALDPMAFTAHVLNISLHLLLKGLWRNGSASDSRSEGWEFESLSGLTYSPFALSMSTHTENTKTYSKLKNPKNLRFGIDKPKANTANHCEPLYLEITNQQKNRVCQVDQHQRVYSLTSLSLDRHHVYNHTCSQQVPSFPSSVIGPFGPGCTCCKASMQWEGKSACVEVKVRECRQKTLCPSG